MAEQSKFPMLPKGDCFFCRRAVYTSDAMRCVMLPGLPHGKDCPCYLPVGRNCQNKYIKGKSRGGK